MVAFDSLSNNSNVSTFFPFIHFHRNRVWKKEEEKEYEITMLFRNFLHPTPSPLFNEIVENRGFAFENRS